MLCLEEYTQQHFGQCCQELNKHWVIKDAVIFAVVFQILNDDSEGGQCGQRPADSLHQECEHLEVEVYDIDQQTNQYALHVG